MTAARLRVTARALVAAAALALALIAWAALRYPGGTWANPQTRGFDWTRNLFSDLLAPEALNGEPNAATPAAAVAMALLALGLVLSLWALASVFFAERPRLAFAIRAAAIAALPGLLLVPLAPPVRAGRFEGWHAVAVFLGAVPALAAALLAIAGLARARLPAARRLFVLGACAVASVFVALFAYAHYLSQGGVPPLALSMLERPPLLLWLAWLLVSAFSLQRYGREG